MSDDQPRDETGKWTAGGGGAGKLSAWTKATAPMATHSTKAAARTVGNIDARAGAIEAEGKLTESDAYRDALASWHHANKSAGRTTPTLGVIASHAGWTATSGPPAWKIYQDALSKESFAGKREAMHTGGWAASASMRGRILAGAAKKGAAA